ncbi:Tyrosine-protein phosphatase non-receptor type 1 [Portunus trituberculatus]|uniref:protein-tyrosine-phosphatase n=1 Tax=Portunus trituberculatus TaxID=210409 RepID=A0A5B7G3N5_PORTR|nr:Tyrosine-protein phosphatase non-receptor type 1 [Portunus trituberculatus]
MNEDRKLSKGLCGSGQGKVVDVLMDMRRQRMGLIQTHDQLRFSYQAIVYGAHKLVEVNGKVCDQQNCFKIGFCKRY